MRIKGKITHWNTDKAYGFITPASGAKEVFVHLKAFVDRSVTPAEGQLVTFSEGTDRQGRPCAVRVALNCAALVWLFTPGGAAFLQGLSS